MWIIQWYYKILIETQPLQNSKKSDCKIIYTQIKFNIKNITCTAIYVYIGLIYCQLNLLNPCNIEVNKRRRVLNYVYKICT